LTTIRDLEDSRIRLIQTDTEVISILESIGLEKQDWRYIFIELESNQAEYKRVWGSDSVNLDDSAYLIYTTQFNEELQN
jgi:hypothetical protein